MKRFIQKTTSIFMSLAMVALIGAPAYATMADSEPEQLKPEIIESVLPDIASETSTLAVDVEAEETEEEILTTEETTSDENTEEPETEEENDTENTENADTPATPSDPVISEEEILDFIESEEVQDALEDAGADLGEIEEDIENGNYEVIYITQEEFEEMRKVEALSVFPNTLTLLGESLVGLLLIPATPIFLCVPFVGAFMLLLPLTMPVLFVGSLAGVVFSPAIATYVYYTYELEPGYEIVD